MVETAIATWTTAAIAGILPLHACPARVGHGVDAEPPSLRSAPCLPLESSKLLRATQGGSSARRRPAEQQHQLSIGSPFEAALPARANAGKRPGRHPAPDRRGFSPPSTGVLMTMAPHVLYVRQTVNSLRWGLTPLEDQQLAGLVMWVPAGTVYAGAALACAALWISHSSAGWRHVHAFHPH